MVEPKKRAPGGGRKPIQPGKRRSRRITIRLTDSEFAVLELYAARTGVGVGAVVRAAVVTFINGREG